MTLGDWLRRYGQNPLHINDARIPKGALAVFLELHIEQGPNLYQDKIPIGVVQGIVGIKRWDCVVNGFANHAGTTPMNRRKDALAAASMDVLAVRDVVGAEEGRQVGTVGYVKVNPGAVNVIPGRVEFPVELRDLDSTKVDHMWEYIQKKFADTDKAENVETRCSLVDHLNPLAPIQNCRLPFMKRQNRSASQRQTCRASLDRTRKRSPGLRQWQ